jgi:hypothetical protein
MFKLLWHFPKVKIMKNIMLFAYFDSFVPLQGFYLEDPKGVSFT